MRCDCLSSCSEKITEGQFVQYGEYKNGKEMLKKGGIPFDTMASAVLYIPEVMEHVNQEVPDYGFFIQAIFFINNYYYQSGSSSWEMLVALQDLFSESA